MGIDMHCVPNGQYPLCYHNYIGLHQIKPISTSHANTAISGYQGWGPRPANYVIYSRLKTKEIQPWGNNIKHKQQIKLGPVTLLLQNLLFTTCRSHAQPLLQHYSAAHSCINFNTISDNCFFIVEKTLNLMDRMK